MPLNVNIAAPVDGGDINCFKSFVTYAPVKTDGRGEFDVGDIHYLGTKGIVYFIVFFRLFMIQFNHTFVIDLSNCKYQFFFFNIKKYQTRSTYFVEVSRNHASLATENIFRPL